MSELIDGIIRATILTHSDDPFIASEAMKVRNIGYDILLRQLENYRKKERLEKQVKEREEREFEFGQKVKAINEKPIKLTRRQKREARKAGG